MERELRWCDLQTILFLTEDSTKDLKDFMYYGTYTKNTGYYGIINANYTMTQ